MKKCPICGARTDSVQVMEDWNRRTDTGNPQECPYCREEEERWNQEMIEGPFWKKNAEKD